MLLHALQAFVVEEYSASFFVLFNHVFVNFESSLSSAHLSAKRRSVVIVCVSDSTFNHSSVCHIRHFLIGSYCETLIGILLILA